MITNIIRAQYRDSSTSSYIFKASGYHTLEKRHSTIEFHTNLLTSEV